GVQAQLRLIGDLLDEASYLIDEGARLYRGMRDPRTERLPELLHAQARAQAVIDGVDGRGRGHDVGPLLVQELAGRSVAGIDEDPEAAGALERLEDVAEGDHVLEPIPLAGGGGHAGGELHGAQGPPEGRGGGGGQR